MKKILTLAYLISETQVCLAMKKRGFGEGNWNGYGGKLEDAETIENATVREIKEESGVDVHENDLKKVAIAEFFFKDGKHLAVHTFFIRSWEGEPAETEEMRPEWFAFNMIPYDKMWADDIHWFPRALQGEKLIGKVWFKEDGESIEKMEWIQVTAFSKTVTK
ncbi:MAG: 8-oxo-dGTP diphosphatase [Candidatus Pacebacteria bacterium]|nr:8-oxo-dGTP diphosphatase [Candidatus Paceibacterota bacterium]MCF7857460.1 8-oxo-dGTP diphosphatase [Candidatus Paceibacterota bacterium]